MAVSTHIRTTSSPNKQLILVPLAVMLLITVLMGFSLHQVTHRWESSLQKTETTTTRLIILNNLRWGLLETKRLQSEKKTDEALAQWQNLKDQVQLLDNYPEEKHKTQLLLNFFNNDANITNIDSLLIKNVLPLRLDRVQEEFRELNASSKFTSQVLFLSLFGLGFILMAITAKDIYGLLKRLDESKKLTIQLQETERRRLAHDLHDGIIQELIAFKRKYSKTEDLPEDCEQLISEMRRICHNLKPQILEDLGFHAGLEQLIQETQQKPEDTTIHFFWDVSPESTFSPEIELNLFRVIQEALHNCERHANANKITISLVYDPSESNLLRVRIHDDGKGFHPNLPNSSDTHHHLGIRGMRERVEQLGGEFTIHSQPQQGTQINIRIPV